MIDEPSEADHEGRSGANGGKKHREEAMEIMWTSIVWNGVETQKCMDKRGRSKYPLIREIPRTSVVFLLFLRCLQMFCFVFGISQLPLNLNVCIFRWYNFDVYTNLVLACKIVSHPSPPPSSHDTHRHVE